MTSAEGTSSGTRKIANKDFVTGTADASVTESCLKILISYAESQRAGTLLPWLVKNVCIRHVIP